MKLETGKFTTKEDVIFYTNYTNRSINRMLLNRRVLYDEISEYKENDIIIVNELQWRIEDIKRKIKFNQEILEIDTEILLQKIDIKFGKKYSYQELRQCNDCNCHLDGMSFCQQCIRNHSQHIEKTNKLGIKELLDN